MQAIKTLTLPDSLQLETENQAKDARLAANSSEQVDESMRLLGRFNPLDLFCLIVLLLATAGFSLAKAGYAGVDQVITGKAMVNIDIYFAGLKTKDPDMFKKGEKTSLTIRNQPIEGALTIADVKHWAKQVSFALPSGKVFAVDDPSQPRAHDFVVTISSEAERTNDGFVIKGGQKIKVGNQVELENFSYRVQGVVVGIKSQH